MKSLEFGPLRQEGSSIGAKKQLTPSNGEFNQEMEDPCVVLNLGSRSHPGYQEIGCSGLILNITGNGIYQHEQHGILCGDNYDTKRNEDFPTTEPNADPPNACLLADEVEVLEPEALGQVFRSEVYNYGKATNFSKFIVRMFYNRIAEFERFIPDTKDKIAHLNWLDHYHRKLQRYGSISISHIKTLFLCARSLNLRNRTQMRCQFISQMISARRVEVVLQNQVVSQRNKQKYLYWCKLFEWRLWRFANMFQGEFEDIE